MKPTRIYMITIQTEESAQPTDNEILNTVTALVNRKITEANLPNNKSAYRVDINSNREQS